MGLLFLLVAVAILTFSSLGTATKIIQQKALKRVIGKVVFVLIFKAGWSKRDIGQVVFVLSVLKVIMLEEGHRTGRLCTF